MGRLTLEDWKMFDNFRIPRDLVEQAGIERVTDEEARNDYGITGTGDMAGIVFPYFLVNGDGRRQRATCRLRRDHPEIEDGKPKNKYISPYGDGRHLYFPPQAEALLSRPETEIVFVEAEKSALALNAWAIRVGLSILPIAMGGCWGWRGRIGKALAPDGTRVDELGPLPKLVIVKGRKCTILFDSNVATNAKVDAARFSFAAALRKLGAEETRTPNLPMDKGANGPDDFLAAHSDEEMKVVLDSGGSEQIQAAETPRPDPQPQRPKLPAFPEVAWRGIFSVYRAAMAKATEASDSFHFAALWSRCSATLGRRISFYQGMWVYPNTYIVSFGPTGDKKTTATRYATNGSTFKVVRGGGSGEGLAEEFSGAAPGEGILLYAEEFSQVLRPARWEGATLIPFLTQCFDCPERYEMKFRNSPLELDQPTPSLLAGATPEWFWMDFKVRDFQGGFGNRLFFFAGTPKAPMALPDEPDLSAIDAVMDALSQIQPVQARFDARARAAWEKFYVAWRQEESGRDDLLLATVKRIPTYIIKLAMTYATLEGTLPEITHDQLRAAILVGQYGVDCAKELLSLQNSGTNPRKELERRILATVNAESNGVTTKRDIYKRLWRHYSDAEAFNRAFDSLLRAGELFTKSAGQGRVWVSTEPMD